MVNALAKVAVEELVTNITQTITVSDINTAKELLILCRQTHLDQLTDKLREPRMRHIIEPLLASSLLTDVPIDDRDYVINLSLVRREQGGSLIVANPIYREIIPRALTSGTQDSLPTIQPSWLTADHQPDPAKLLTTFLAFWRQHGQPECPLP